MSPAGDIAWYALLGPVGVFIAGTVLGWPWGLVLLLAFVSLLVLEGESGMLPEPAELEVSDDAILLRGSFAHAVGPLTVGSLPLFLAAGLASVSGGAAVTAGLVVGLGLSGVVYGVGRRSLFIELDTEYRRLRVSSPARRVVLPVGEVAWIRSEAHQLRIAHSGGEEWVALPEGVDADELAEVLNDRAWLLGADPEVRTLRQKARDALSTVRE